MSRLILYLLGGLVGIVLIVIMVMWVEAQVLGYSDITQTITYTMLVAPFANFIDTVAEGLGSPFAGMTTYFESILPEAMRPYAWVVAVLLTGGISLISILVILKVANRI